MNLGPPKPLTPEAQQVWKEETERAMPLLRKMAEISGTVIGLELKLLALKPQYEAMREKSHRAMEATMPEMDGIEYQIDADGKTYRQILSGAAPKRPDWAVELEAKMRAEG